MTTQERWLPFPETDGRYLISNYGRIHSVARAVVNTQTDKVIGELSGRICSVHLNPRGSRVFSYRVLGQGKKHKTVLVGRLVYKLFIGDIPEGHQVRYYDGDTANCSTDNLYLFNLKDWNK